jgi:hypothetical protein
VHNPRDALSGIPRYATANGNPAQGALPEGHCIAFKVGGLNWFTAGEASRNASAGYYALHFMALFHGLQQLGSANRPCRLHKSPAPPAQIAGDP